LPEVFVEEHAMAQVRIAPVAARKNRDAGASPAAAEHRTLKQQAAQLAAANALLRAAVDNMHQGFLVTDPDGNVVMWNQRFLELNGVPADAIRAGMPGIDLIRAAAATGEYGPGDPEALATRRFAELRGGREGVTRRRPNGMVIDYHTNRMPSGHVIRTYTDITGAVARENEIENQRALLAGTLANVDQGILVLDKELRLRLWNRRALELLGLPPEFCRVGLPLAHLIAYFPRRRGAPPEEVAAAVAMRITDFAADHVITLPPHAFDGRIIERRRRGLPDGGFVLIYSDTTEAWRREQEIAEKSALLAATLESMDQGMLVLDTDMRVRIWNHRLAELLELPADFIKSAMPASELLQLLSDRAGHTPEHTEREIAIRLDSFRAGEIRRLEGPELHGRVLERRSRPMPGGGLVVTYSDVTEAKEREDELAENSTLLGATLDNMDQGLILIDAEHRAKLWNNRLIDMFDLPPEVLRVGRPFAEILRYFIEAAGTPAERVEGELATRLVELREHPVAVLERHRPDGRVIERRRRVMPLGGSVITYGDVTERKQGEAALRHAKEEAEIASRSKTEFLANMSHELRTPLNAIIGFSDILARQLFGPLGQERYIEYAHDIHDSGQHLLNLINDVLDIAKIEVNKTELAEETVNAHEVIDACLRLMRDRAAAAGVEIAARLGPDLPRLRADDRRLKQILLNLVSNAVKFTPPGGRVEIRAEALADGFRFVVADTGIGIAPEDIATALTPFGQIDSSLARRYQGTGLGLPLARSMTELHGGRLEIESAPGSGTAVTVWLPPNRVAR
jgi:signal transduction histidine kinase